MKTLCEILAVLFFAGGLFAMVSGLMTADLGAAAAGLVAGLAGLAGWGTAALLIDILTAVKLYLRDTRNLLRGWQEGGLPAANLSWAPPAERAAGER